MGVIDAWGLYIWVILIGVPAAIGTFFSPAGSAAGVALGKLLDTKIGAVLLAVGVVTVGINSAVAFYEIYTLINQFLDENPGLDNETPEVVLKALPEDKKENVGN